MSIYSEVSVPLLSEEHCKACPKISLLMNIGGDDALSVRSFFPGNSGKSLQARADEDRDGKEHFCFLPLLAIK